jgi:hypothetical protein
MTGFHVHVDATELSTAFERVLIDELGFWRSDFEGHPDGAEGFEPPHHLTSKMTDGAAYRRAFSRVVSLAEEHSTTINGYIEGEYVASDVNIPWRPYDQDVAVPWRAESGRLSPGEFRESEIHITLSREGTSPELVKALRGMGFFSAYLRKSFGRAEVFTVQGSRKIIAAIAPSLEEFLRKAGGAKHCSMMEERVAGWWASSAKVSLPPVLTRIEWMK